MSAEQSAAKWREKAGFLMERLRALEASALVHVAEKQMLRERAEKAEADLGTAKRFIEDMGKDAAKKAVRAEKAEAAQKNLNDVLFAVTQSRDSYQAEVEWLKKLANAASPVDAKQIAGLEAEVERYKRWHDENVKLFDERLAEKDAEIERLRTKNRHLTEGIEQLKAELADVRLLHSHEILRASAFLDRRMPPSETDAILNARMREGERRKGGGSECGDAGVGDTGPVAGRPDTIPTKTGSAAANPAAPALCPECGEPIRAGVIDITPAKAKFEDSEKRVRALRDDMAAAELAAPAKSLYHGNNTVEPSKHPAKATCNCAFGDHIEGMGCPVDEPAKARKEG